MNVRTRIIHTYARGWEGGGGVRRLSLASETHQRYRLGEYGAAGSGERTEDRAGGSAGNRTRD